MRNWFNDLTYYAFNHWRFEDWRDAFTWCFAVGFVWMLLLGYVFPYNDWNVVQWAAWSVGMLTMLWVTFLMVVSWKRR